MATVTYNGKRIIPAPFVSVNRTSQNTGDGTQVGAVFQINITGKIVAWSGSPDQDGVFWELSGFPPGGGSDADVQNLTQAEHFAAILRKTEAIRQLFATEGHSLEWQALDGSPPMKCNPRNIVVTYQEGRWFNTVDFTISCECDVLYINGTSVGEYSFDEYISTASESWQFESNGEEYTGVPPTYRVTHTVSAQGKRFYNEGGTLEKDAWEWAKDFVVARLGLDAAILAGSKVGSLAGYTGYNHIRSEDIDELGGTYSVTESWIASTEAATEVFEVSTTRSEDSPYVRVSINGIVTGFDVRTSELAISSYKLANAETKWTTVQGLLYTRAAAISAVTGLNIVPLNTTVGKNPILGTINYNYDYDDRPSRSITNTISENISVSHSWGVDVVASIGVLGRALGPVLQDIGSHNATTRDLSIELVFNKDYYGGSLSWPVMLNDYNPRVKSPQSAEIQAIVDAVAPIAGEALNNVGGAATVQYITNQTEQWLPKERRYIYNISWTYE